MRKNPSNIDFLAKCSVCEADLDPQKIIVLEEKNQKTTLHVTCSKCTSAVLVFVSGNQNGIISVGVATDLDAQEVRYKIGKEAISTDDILDLHQFIVEEKNDWKSIIKNIS